MTTNVPTKVDRWRRENPDHWSHWTTAHGGYVLQLWGWRVFYGRCRDCGELVTTRRCIIGRGRRGGPTRIGRWPVYCTECREARYAAHDAGATERMRRLRAARKAFREDQFRQQAARIAAAREKARSEPRHKNAR